MKVWLSTAELAGLPGLPGTTRGITLRARRESWQSRQRKARGGGLEYHLDSLPAVTQACLARRSSSEGAAEPEASPESRRADLWRRFERATDRRKEDGARRAHLLDELEELIAEGKTVTAAVDELGERHGIARGTWHRWRRQVRGLHRSDWMAALLPRWRGNPARAECSPEAWDAFKADYLRLERPAASACYERLQRLAGHEDWTVPSLPALLRRLRAELPRPVLVLARQGEEALARTYPAQQRDHSVFDALEAVNADGHRFDVFARWPDGTIHRPMMVAWQDIYSGKILSYRVDQTEHAGSVRLAFGDLVERWGIPSHAYLDNGRGFAAKVITGGTATRYRFTVKAEDPAGLLTSLGVQVHWATPYHGQAKPIERAFRDLCEYVAKHPAFAGAYTGNNPQAKPENYQSRAVPLEVFLRVLDQEIKAHNTREGRRSTVCAGRSFDATFAESYLASTVRKASAAQRRLWLLAAEAVRASTVDGSLRLANNRYWSEEVAALAGQKLIVRFDPERLHETVHVYTLSGDYVGEAPCVLAVGFADQDAAREHAKAKRSRRRAVKEQRDAERRLDVLELAGRLPELEDDPDPAPAAVELVHPRLTAAFIPARSEEELEEEQEQRDAAFKRAVDLIAGSGG
ncbi:MAG: transposase domain-containing protein [Deltaproteobacteria bacterium]|nr:transposase domain-containing protein [Deltaproteobacteria bacterium]